MAARTLPKNQRAIDGATYQGNGIARERIRIENTDGLVLELTPTGHKAWRCYASDATGKKVWKTIGPARSVSLGRAVDAAKAFVEATKLGTNTPGETYDQLVRDWIERHGKVFKKSWEEDEALYQRHIYKRLGATPLAAIDTRLVVSVTTDIATAATPSQARAAHALISSSLTWAVKAGRKDSNPAKGAPRAAPTVHRDRMFSDAELRAIWSGTARLNGRSRAEGRGAPLEIATKLLLLLGSRRSEIVEMEKAELNLSEKLLVIRAERRKGWRIGKKKVPHVVPLPPVALDLVKQALALSGNSRFVFPHRTKSDAPMSADNLTTMFGAMLAAVGVKDGRLHDLRHVAKTLMVRNGVSRFDADAAQDHRGVGNAGDIYDAYDYLKEKRRALEVLEAAVLRIVS